VRSKLNSESGTREKRGDPIVLDEPWLEMSPEAILLYYYAMKRVVRLPASCLLRYDKVR
jgi:hypothetical protein